MSPRSASSTRSSGGASRAVSSPRASTSQGRVSSPGSNQTSSASASASIPLVICPTTFGIPSPPAPVRQPARVTVDPPPAAASDLAACSDDLGQMRLIAPRGWACAALYGADGRGGVALYPTGQALPSSWWRDHWRASVGSTVAAVVGTETSACLGCSLDQACPLFSAAVSLAREDGISCLRGFPRLLRHPVTVPALGDRGSPLAWWGLGAGPPPGEPPV